MGLLLLLRKTPRPAAGKLLPPLVISAVLVALAVAAEGETRARLLSMVAAVKTAPTTSANRLYALKWFATVWLKSVLATTPSI